MLRQVFRLTSPESNSGSAGVGGSSAASPHCVVTPPSSLPLTSSTHVTSCDVPHQGASHSTGATAGAAIHVAAASAAAAVVSIPPSYHRSHSSVVVGTPSIAMPQPMPPAVVGGGTVARVAGSRLLATPISHLVWQRLSVLISLLLLQSLSQFVLEAYEGLIAANVVVPLFLTMLVGAGGNAGNQAAVHAITGLVTGDLKPHHFATLVKREFLVGLVSSACLFFIGFIRVFLYYSNEEVQPTPVLVTVFAISLSLFFIVLASVVLGSALPFLLRWLRFDVEHAAPMIQVMMDIFGVLISCIVCSVFLPAAVSNTGASTAPPSPSATPLA